MITRLLTLSRYLASLLLAMTAFDYHLATADRPHKCNCGAYWIDELNTTLTGWRQTG